MADPMGRAGRMALVVRMAFFATGDAILVALSVLAAVALRFEGRIPSATLAQLPLVVPIAVGSASLALLALGCYRVAWSFVGLRDVGRVAVALIVGSLLFAAIIQLAHAAGGATGIPRSVVFIQAPIAFCLVSAFRLAKRAHRALALQRSAVSADRARTLLVGAGDAGVQVLKSIQDTKANHFVLGFIDDDRLAQGTRIHGVPVLGPTESLPRHLAQLNIECVIVCVASADSRLVRSIVEACRAAKVETVRIIPPFSQIVDGKVHIKSTRDVSLEDLLGREPIRIDHEELRGFLRGRRVVVTGAAGTIGSELCRQIARFEPFTLHAVDVDESRLHDLVVDLRQAHVGLRVHEALVDVRDAREIGALMERAQPHVVFHAAAYKHVPMMELYPLAAIETNVIGTLLTAEAAETHGCERFILISTDKAVEPSSIMGASKRLAELALLSGAGKAAGAMSRSAVRFGNVIGSRGSVIPIFERQLERGGPLTVTHPDMKRFFMMTSEAVSLVLQAGQLGTGGDVFVLDMGKPVRILDVAREFIRLHGLEPDRDIKIEITGLRQGEKLEEVLTYRHERLAGTRHPRILRVEGASIEAYPGALFEKLEATVREVDDDACRNMLRQLFPSLVQVEVKASARPAVEPAWPSVRE